jgi:hypothetical protein
MLQLDYISDADNLIDFKQRHDAVFISEHV